MAITEQGRMTPDMDDVHYMKMALALAERGRGYTSPNPMVGAVVVADGEIVGRGWHERLGGAHAEVNAIDDAGKRSRGATMYVTLEPCNHTGKTPPCTEKILGAGIRKVVMAMEDPNPHVAGGGARRLEENGVTVTGGVCREAAEKLNESFVKYIRTGRPLVIAKCAATLDGRIATRTNDSKWVTGEAAREHVHRIRHAVDGIMVGMGTVRADNPSLTTRLPEGNGADPHRIILDTHLSIPADTRLLHLDSNAETLIVCGHSASESRASEIEKWGARVIRSPEKDGRIDLDALMDILGDQGVASLLVEGGSQVMAEAFHAGIVDKCMFFYAPKIYGGSDGVPICAGKGPATMAGCMGLREMTVRHFDPDILVEGYVTYPASGEK